MSRNKKIILFVCLFIATNLIPYIPIKDCWAVTKIYTEQNATFCSWKLCQQSLIPCLHTERETYYLGIGNHILGLWLAILLSFAIPYLLTLLVVILHKKIKK